MPIRLVPKLARDLWLPALVAALGFAIAFGVSEHFEREQRSGIQRSAQAIAAESRASIALVLHQHLAAVADLANGWARFGRAPEPEWAGDALLLMKNVSGIRYIAWVSLGTAPVRLARLPEATEPVRIDEAEARAHADRTTVVGPERRPEGGFSYRLYQPVPPGAGAPGVLVAGVDVDGLLARVLRDTAPGYAISVFWGDQRILTHGSPADASAFGWWRSEGQTPFAGVVWRVVHQPTAELAASLLTPFPVYLRVGGCLLALALALIVYQLRQARQQGRFLAAANRILDLNMREAREGQAALRRLSEELEQRVRERTHQLERALGDLESFNFSVSHDLRAPIGAALNFLAILEEEHGAELPPEARELVSRVRGSAERAIHLLEGLLKLSHAGRAELQIEIEPLDMEALAREAFAQVRDAEDAGALELVVGPLPPAHGDRALIESVFANLLGNAVKYTRGREKRRIVVSGAPHDAENVYSVSDNGVGFDDRYASKLFGAFERLHPPDQFEGAGIGLAIVARIVSRHGGRVWAEGRPEQGATFFFSLARPGGGRP